MSWCGLPVIIKVLFIDGLPKTGVMFSISIKFDNTGYHVLHMVGIPTLELMHYTLRILMASLILEIMCYMCICGLPDTGGNVLHT